MNSRLGIPLVALTGLLCCVVLMFSRVGTSSFVPDASPEEPSSLGAKRASVVSHAHQVAATEKGQSRLKLSDAPQVRAALDAARAEFEQLERRNARVVQELRDANGGEHIVVSIPEPNEDDYHAYQNTATAVVGAFQGSAGEKELLREEVADLIAQFTDFPMPRKILIRAVSADGKSASFSERFAPTDEAGKIDEETFTTRSGGNDRYRDDDWLGADSWARRRYHHLFIVTSPNPPLHRTATGSTL